MMAMRIASLVAFALNAIVWGGFTVLGIEIAVDQLARGYPNWDRYIYYAAFPSFMLCIILIRVIFGLWAGKQNLGLGTYCATLAVFPFWVTPYTGGI
jgi:hypothetical protein